jgi:hypothetical protein
MAKALADKRNAMALKLRRRFLTMEKLKEFKREH